MEKNTISPKMYLLLFYRKRAMKKSFVSFLICLLPFAAFAQDTKTPNPPTTGPVGSTTVVTEGTGAATAYGNVGTILSGMTAGGYMGLFIVTVAGLAIFTPAESTTSNTTTVTTK